MYGSGPNWDSGRFWRSLIVEATVLGEALSRALQTWRRVSSLKWVWEGTKGSRGFSLKRAWIWLRGFQPAKSSNLESAIAISGLWFVSPNFLGSFSCSLAASERSGWIWRGRALLKERIWNCQVRHDSTARYFVLDLPLARTEFPLPIYPGLTCQPAGGSSSGIHRDALRWRRHRRDL